MEGMTLEKRTELAEQAMMTMSYALAISYTLADGLLSSEYDAAIACFLAAKELRALKRQKHEYQPLASVGMVLVML
ncbi:MAG: hypothetical protein EBS84_21920 [Proteobacteria bacterium]|nr:hypothetical protein [Pseudomonadota bacterium]